MSNARMLPAHVAPYAETPVFTSDTVPSKLLSHHDLKPGTWGLMHVKRGAVRFFVEDGDEPVAVLNKDDTFVILPEERHYIKVSNDVKFYIEFLK